MLDFNLFLISNVEDIFVFLVLKTAIEIRKAFFLEKNMDSFFIWKYENLNLEPVK